ncbi:phosphotransferase (plasmid) [Coraliomargarita sp. W4R53]
MARSPLTLAASVTSALPQVGVVRVSALTEGASGHFDSARAELDDGRSVVVRVPNDATAAAELTAETAALRTLTAGVRELLPFRAPEFLGEVNLGSARGIVVDFLPGYRVDAAHLPPGRGIATSLGEALAAVHALPVSIVREEGLPARSPQQVRTDVARLLDRAEATGHLPQGLLARWRRAAVAESLWRFESTVVLGPGGAASFLFEDVDDVPQATGQLDWHGFGIGDPAADLHWLASAPVAAEDVYAAYVARSERAPDAMLRARARMYAELEFAKWLVHGHEIDNAEVMQDAGALLAALDSSTAGDEIVPTVERDVDGALAFLDQMASTPSGGGDTSMQTDAYDAEELAQWVAREDAATENSDASDDDAVPDRTELDHAEVDHTQTAPIDLSDLVFPGDASERTREQAEAAAGSDRTAADATPGAEDNADAHAAEAERASDAALRRWLSE